VSWRSAGHDNSCGRPAWSQFCKNKEAMIQKAFRDLGVTLPVDGSRDHELQIKGFAAEDFKIGTSESDILNDSHAFIT